MLGAALLVLGLPRLVSALTMLPAEGVLDAVQAGRSVGEDDLGRFEGRWSLARQFSASGRIATDLAAARLAQSERLPKGSEAERRRLVEESVDLLEEGLAKTPANSFAWARLAYALSLRDGPDVPAVDAWRMSVLTAPADRRLVLWRARMGIALLSRLREGDHDLLDRQIRFAWYADGKGLARYAKEAGPQVVDTIRIALLDTPEDLARFNQLTK